MIVDTTYIMLLCSNILEYTIIHVTIVEKRINFKNVHELSNAKQNIFLPSVSSIRNLDIHLGNDKRSNLTRYII